MSKHNRDRMRQIYSSSRKQRSANPPIEKSITYNLETAVETEEALAGNIPAYLRFGKNATIELLEHKLALWESGTQALCTSSGMAAIAMTALTATKEKDQAVLVVPAYGGTWGFWKEKLPAILREPRFMPATKWYLYPYNDAITSRTRLILFEPVTNPTMDVVDIKTLLTFARSRAPDAMIVADNTFASSWNLRPLEWGVDAVVISTTKYHNGFSDHMSGVVVIGEECQKRFPNFFAELTSNFRAYGPVLDPMAASDILQALETYPIRMQKHNTHALRLARWLTRHPMVENVRYPGLASPSNLPAFGQMRAPGGSQGFSGMLSFRIHGGTLARDAFLDALPFSGDNLVRHAASLGSVKTLVESPSRISHASIDARDRHTFGMHEGDIRVSVGIEEPFELIIEDFKMAFANAHRTTKQ